MSAFVGAQQQLKHFLRLNRLQLAVWPVVFGSLLWAMADSLSKQYASIRERADYAALNEASSVLRALNGPGHALVTDGGILVFEVGAYLLLIGALVAVFIVVKHTRGEEESGRAELTGAVPSGRLAGLIAGLLGMTILAGLTAAASAGAMLLSGLPMRGSVAYSLGLFVVMIFFGAVAGVTAQVSVRARTASGLAGVTVAVSYAVRALGDVDRDGLSWASPFGWVQAARPFAGERWWPILLTVGAAVLVASLGAALRLLRDDGAGLFPGRPGPAVGSAALSGIWAVRCKQIGGPLLSFSLLTAFLAGVFGFAGEDVADVFEAGSGTNLLLGIDEFGVRDAYFSMVITLIMMLIAAFGISSMGRLRGDEESGLAEFELATSIGRFSWVTSAFVSSLVGCLLLGSVGGLALAGSYAFASGDRGLFWDMFNATLLQLPAVAILVSLCLAVFGVIPRLMPLNWVALGFCAIVGLLGPALQLDQFVLDLSPFTHVPKLPSLLLDLSTWVLGAVSLALATAGLIGLVRRDV